MIERCEYCGRELINDGYYKALDNGDVIAYCNRDCEYKHTEKDYYEPYCYNIMEYLLKIDKELLRKHEELQNIIQEHGYNDLYLMLINCEDLIESSMRKQFKGGRNHKMNYFLAIVRSRIGQY